MTPSPIYPRLAIPGRSLKPKFRAIAFFEALGGRGIFMHLPQVGPHQLASCFWAAPLDRFKNSFVVKLSVFGTALDTKNPETLFAQQADDGIQQRQDERIARGLRQRQMEVEVGLDVG